MNRLPSIYESQNRFLQELDIMSWESASLLFIENNLSQIDQLEKDYYKSILIYFPYPISKIIYENIVSNFTPEDIYKYQRCHRMHSFSEIEELAILSNLLWMKWSLERKKKDSTLDEYNPDYWQAG